ncbi:hypothetical protein HMPREF0591_0822 [Mycobacterium parascrofulaceum ATCC BAA-614]|uniref:Uncharacterized protein n=1 Tax=Mycobacterium parascrofulaceum ATCC BAA-614 TaxID=525368 RepID=D5P3S8_9MYCO|nr:hypothetical protein HMPREF0591_0822 [Mycobacterium parascrofulaceum ATCC BAA-614]
MIFNGYQSRKCWRAQDPRRANALLEFDSRARRSGMVGAASAA